MQKGLETTRGQYEVDQRFFLERKEKLRINTGAGPTRGLSSLPVPEGQPGPRQQGGVPPAVLKAFWLYVIILSYNITYDDDIISFYDIYVYLVFSNYICFHIYMICFNIN